MANVYSCPVHVDQQSNEPQRLCPLCGQRPILLRAAVVEGAPLEPAPAPVPLPETDLDPVPLPEPLPAPSWDPATDLDAVIALLSEMRDRLRGLA
ncbi:MAG TPA: hypothetical protein VLS89_14805 [Candidatus Nanopelagicales bacterium]|nr:hypothetical protein [Candidatus Nanopelagicales bacterium]